MGESIRKDGTYFKKKKKIMGYFPFFIEIEEKDGLIVGGGNIAAHKIEKLKPFHPRLTVIAPKIGEEIKKDTSLVWKERMKM